MSARVLAARVVSLLSLALAGCGGGGGGGGSPPAPTGPVATVKFPPISFLTDAATAPLDGTAADPDGVQAVTVNGVGAASGNGFADWNAVLPVPVGDTPVVVAAVDALGNPNPAAAAPSLARNQGPMLGQIASIAYDGFLDRILVLDGHLLGIVSVDPVSHTGTMLSGAGVGSGPSIGNTHSMALASGLGKAYVAVPGSGAVIGVDLATGNRAYVTGQGVGTGVALSSSYHVAVDGTAGFGCATDAAAASIVRFELATGNRTTISGNGVGTGPAFGPLGEMALDVAHDRLFLVTGPSFDEIFSVNLTTGARALVSSAAVGTGPQFGNALHILYDAPAGRLLLTQSGGIQVLAVDPSTGNRTLLNGVPGGGYPADYGFPSYLSGVATDLGRAVAYVGAVEYAAILALDLSTGTFAETYRPAIGTGPLLGNLRSAALDAAGHRMVVFANTHDGLLAVDTTTGNRTGFPTSGDAFYPPNRIVVEPTANRAFTASFDLGQSTIGTIDLATGAHAILTGPANGAGPLFTDVRGMAPDPAAQSLYAADGAGGRVFLIDVATGNRTIVASSQVGSGPTIVYGGALVLDGAAGILYLADLNNGFDRILAIDLATGARTILSGAAAGAGPALNGVTAIALDPATGRILAAQSRQVVAIDVSSGDRTMIAGSGVGTGPGLYESPVSIDIEPATGFLWVSEQYTCRLLLIDPATGNRVVVSK